jgi:DNA-binding transcriptional regulator YdaS (Cro superfamily)
MAYLHPIDRAAVVLNISLVALAERLGVTKGAVGQWKEKGRVVPAEHCPVIERMTNGAVKCEELNPKVDWAYLRAAAA